MFSLFSFSSIFQGDQLTPFAPMCGRPCGERKEHCCISARRDLESRMQAAVVALVPRGTTACAVLALTAALRRRKWQILSRRQTN